MSVLHLWPARAWVDFFGNHADIAGVVESTTKEYQDMFKAEIVAGLTELELLVYGSMIKCQIGCAGPDGITTDLKNSLKESKVTPSQFAGVLGSLAKKGLYENIYANGDSHWMFPRKTVVIDGVKETVRSDIGKVFLDDETEQKFSK